MHVKPIETYGYFKAIFFFELWFALSGVMYAFEEYGGAALFLAWNVVRLIISPFLRFMLVRCMSLIVVLIVILAFSYALSFAPESDFKYFGIVSMVFILGPAVAMFHLWKMPNIKKLIGQFESSREGI